MSTQHTPGRLKMRKGFHEDEIEIFRPGRSIKKPFFATELATVDAKDKKKGEANARRLVACWNVCEGLEIGEIEKWGLGSATGGAIYRLTQQRDELLAALKSIMERLDDDIQAATDDELAYDLSDPQCPEHIKKELACVIACRAVIAKSEGGAA